MWFPPNIGVFTMLSFSLKNNLNYLINRSCLPWQNLTTNMHFIYMVSNITSTIFIQACREHVNMDRVACFKLDPARQRRHGTGLPCTPEGKGLFLHGPLGSGGRSMAGWGCGAGLVAGCHGRREVSCLTVLIQPFPKPALPSNPP